MTFAPKHILVPLAVEDNDELAFAEQAVSASCDLAKQFGSKVTLIHFASVPSPLPAQDENADASARIYETMAMVLQERLKSAKEQLVKLQKKAEEQGVKTELHVVDADESIAHAICHAATKEAADLILVGSHARRGLKQFLLGSVAERVVHLSPLNVLLLRHES